MVFGNTLGIGYFSNTQLSTCTASPCLTVTRSGAYTEYGNLNVKVVGSSGAPMPNATVSIIDSNTGTVSYEATSNATGWAVAKVLLVQVSKSGSTNIPAYLVQASWENMSSSQQSVVASGSVSTSLVIAASPSLGTLPVASLTAGNLATLPNLKVFTYPIYPSTIYKIGVYLSASYTPYITLATNSLPFSFYNNASARFLSFSTCGLTGQTFYFAAIYPKNFTLQSLGVFVDGCQTPATLESNSSYYFTIFSIPSGNHQVSLGYNPPPASYNVVQYPKFYPGVDVVAGVAGIGAVGLVLLFLFTRRRDRQVPQPTGSESG